MEIFVKIAILSIASVTFLRNIANFPLRNWDEAWYAEIIKNMASGQYSYLVSFWNGQYIFDKPPLYFWLSLPFFKIFGPGEWQARIISVIAAVFATFLVYLIARRMLSQRIALLAVVIFLTLGQVAVRFAHGNLDALVVCLILATVYFYLAFSKFSFASAIFLALTYLAKGWILGLLPILLIFFWEYFLLGRNFKRFFLLIGFSIVLVAPYYVLGYFKFGNEFASWILNPTAGLFSQQAFSLQFFGNLLRDVGFWFVPLVLSLGMVSKIKDEDWRKLFVLISVLLVFLFAISFLSGKLGWYALPVYPFAAIIIAYFIFARRTPRTISPRMNARERIHTSEYWEYLLAHVNLRTIPRVLSPRKFIDRIFEKGLVLALMLLAVTIALQVYNVNRIENLHPDRSAVGANLGKEAARIVPAGDLLILDDRDLPAFLFYSEHKKVLVVSSGSVRDWEWWIYQYEDLPELLSMSKNVWIVTRNPDLISDASEMAEVEGYKFLKYTNEI